jgi:hypothetical protein
MPRDPHVPAESAAHPRAGGLCDFQAQSPWLHAPAHGPCPCGRGHGRAGLPVQDTLQAGRCAQSASAGRRGHPGRGFAGGCRKTGFRKSRRTGDPVFGRASGRLRGHKSHAGQFRGRSLAAHVPQPAKTPHQTRSSRRIGGAGEIPTRRLRFPQISTARSLHNLYYTKWSKGC